MKDKVVKLPNDYQGIPEVLSDTEKELNKLEYKMEKIRVAAGKALWYLSDVARLLASDYHEYPDEKKEREKREGLKLKNKKCKFKVKMSATTQPDI